MQPSTVNPLKKSPSTSFTWRPGKRPTARCNEGLTSLLRRWAPDAVCKWSYGALINGLYKWVSGVINLLIGAVTPFITGNGRSEHPKSESPPWDQFMIICGTLPEKIWANSLYLVVGIKYTTPFIGIVVVVVVGGGGGGGGWLGYDGTKCVTSFR